LLSPRPRRPSPWCRLLSAGVIRRCLWTRAHLEETQSILKKVCACQRATIMAGERLCRRRRRSLTVKPDP
jgi:hypothetical protein